MRIHVVHRLAGLLATLGALVWSVQAAAQSTPDIPYERFVLANGLTVIVHEDHKAPIVAVNVWYHVGSKNEQPGHTGFAHLFEHLMFNGSEHYDKEFQAPLERAGATDLNGTTNEDRTNYFVNVPTSALDLELWLESDRMGHLVGAITQAKLDEQRGVVQNEKRQDENEPYGKVWDFLTPRLYPPNHPYSWTVIGSMEDLNAAKLDDVKGWFQSYYGPSNAVLVIAGDIDVKTAKEKVEHYFGDIPPGPPVARQEAWIAKRTGSQRGTMQDRVPQARIYKVWNVPPWSSADASALEIAASVLSDGKSSRLYKRLVYTDQIATDVDASVEEHEIGGLFTITASARPGTELARVEKAVDEELARFLAGGPTPAELARVKTRARAGFIRGIERIGGFGGKSDVLAQGEVFAGRPDFYKVRQQRVAAATVSEVKTVASRWLVRRRLHPRGPSLPRLRRGSGWGGSQCPACARRRPEADLPHARARDAFQWPQDRPRRAPLDSSGALRPAARRGIRLGPVRAARHGEPGHGDARRGDHESNRHPDQRSSRRAGGEPRRRLTTRRFHRVARGAARQARLFARSLRRRRPAPRVPAVRGRPSQEAAARADPAGEGRPGWPRAPGLSTTRLR